MNRDYTVDQKTGCWNWAGNMNPAGYGYVNLPGKGARLGHRLYYEKHKGPIPQGLQIDHLCRNRACVNPEHLEAVTSQENTRRGPKTHQKRQPETPIAPGFLPSLTKRQREVYDAIDRFIRFNNYPPSYAEIGVLVGLKSLATIHKQVHNLIRKGYLLKSGKRLSRALTTSVCRHCGGSL